MQQEEAVEAGGEAGREVNADLDLTAQQLFGRPRTSATSRRYSGVPNNRTVLNNRTGWNTL